MAGADAFQCFFFFRMHASASQQWKVALFLLLLP
jgi:hypothetical protein